MNNTPSLSADNPRINSVAYLITVGLGYCCEYFFWHAYRELSADLIAARLGVTPDTVRRHRLWAAEGRFTCPKSSTCLARRLGLS